MRSHGIESPLKYKKKRKEAHPPRNRKAYAGELLQVDASKFQWFFNDEAYYHLHGAIDDSTGLVTGVYLEKEETIHGYQMILAQTITNYGIPDCLYTDFRTVFQSSKQKLSLDEELRGDEIKSTKFAKTLKRLGVDITSTKSPQAKGRIERLWQTFQNRLYNELKKLNITSFEEANDFITSSFIPRHNAKFALPLDTNKNLFVRPLLPFDCNLELATWDYRCVINNCYISYKSQHFLIYDNGLQAFLPNKAKCLVYTFLDGSLHLFHDSRFLNLSPVAKPVFSSKLQPLPSPQLSQKQNAARSRKPAADHPWRSEFTHPRYFT